jgi:hypothetical protein
MSKFFDIEPAGSGRSGSKSFNISLSFRRSQAQDEDQAKKVSLSKIKLAAELSFQDIEGSSADQMRYKIRGAREVMDLWMLRSDIHQLIARKISQQEAAKRINDLLPCFKHWVPKNSLIKI